MLVRWILSVRASHTGEYKMRKIVRDVTTVFRWIKCRNGRTVLRVTRRVDMRHVKVR